MNKDYVDFYNRITKPYKNAFILALLKLFYKVLPVIVALSYLVLIAGIYYEAPYIIADYKDKGEKFLLLIKAVLKPLSAFIVLSLIRKCIDAGRPYELYEINPLINRKKKGESMPSRHILSITIIAMVWLYVNLYIGVFFLLLSVLLSYIRVVAGVHFPKDVIAGFIFALIWGFISLFII